MYNTSEQQHLNHLTEALVKGKGHESPEQKAEELRAVIRWGQRDSAV